MKLLNAEAPQGLRSAAPKTLRVGEHRVAYYPADMALFALGDEPARARNVVPTIPPPCGTTTIQMICLYLTRECNLACDYCFVRPEPGYRSQKATAAPQDLMTERTVCRALDVLRESKRGQVSFFGGEPLLAWNRLRWTVERAESLTKWSRVPMGFHVTTNATLLDEERADYLAAHGFSLIVSIDGPRSLHDAHRKHPNGDGTFEEVSRALELIGSHPTMARQTTLRSTFTPGEARIPERLECLNALADDGVGAAVSIEPATGCSACSGLSRGYRRGELLRAYLDGARWCVRRAREGKSARWVHLNKSLQRLRNREPSWSECGAAKGYCSAAPDGTIHACHHEGYVIGHVLTGLNPERQAPWRDNRLTAHAKCSRCWIRNVCGGGCRMEAYWEHKDLHQPAGIICALSKARTVAAMWTLAELADEPEALEIATRGAVTRPQEAQ